MSVLRRNIFILIFCLLCFDPEPGFAKGARLADIIVTNSRDTLVVYLKLEGGFSRKIQEAVFSGVPTTFSFFITLEEGRTFWTDRVLAETVLHHTIKYNSLKKAFTVTRSWDSGPPVLVRSFEAARKLMTEVDGLRLIPLSRLTRGRRYTVSAKAKLSKITLPFYLRYLLIMASQWEFETDWHTIDLTY
ncbi:DUF4390 domain-containing protein [Desulfonema ishimotonii]|uniref:DUF4390 domain-containing protein n=1 Tax=Desulfonema ishimotonii TaxID=45657 RepID=A0A401G0V6_9BACT|nr:DUF4390 domain-containing protein [Desulfonema ishimotonii]GBC62854.1 DUF4390 domain-containing protein [Desulfonema ishimotonii]